MTGKKIIPGLVALLGAGFAILATFAYAFGVARTQDWGPGRIVVAILGMFLLLVAFLMQFGAAIGKCWGRLMDKAGQLPVVQSWKATVTQWKAAWKRLLFIKWVGKSFSKIYNSRPVRYFTGSKKRMALLTILSMGGIVLVTQIWFVSVGYWTEWPVTTTYYSQLSDAFLHGQVSLLEEPSPSLLALEDPYQYENRQGVPYIWDAVLYNGKFYLYWGPIPALILSVVRWFYREAVGDQMLVFGFVFGLWMFGSLLLLRIRDRLFPQFGLPYLIPGLLMLGLANPILWILNRPAVYEAAIMGGQFFLVAGLFFGFTGLEGERPVAWKLALASSFWILAAGCRVSVLGAALFLTTLTGLWILLQRIAWRRKAASLAAVGLPLIGGLVALGLYNYVRFGSWFEFGFRYQLTGTNTRENTITFANFWINAYNYLINPFKTSLDFPFLIPDWGGHLIFFPIPSTPNYYTEQVSGVLLTTPYVLLALIPILFLGWLGWGILARARKKVIMQRADERFLSWTALTISGAGLLSFAPILFFISATMRYLGDAVPLLVLMSTVGFWQGMKSLENNTTQQKWFCAFVTLLVLASIAISILLTLTGCDNRLAKLNPAVYDQLFNFFSR